MDMASAPGSRPLLSFFLLSLLCSCVLTREGDEQITLVEVPASSFRPATTCSSTTPNGLPAYNRALLVLSSRHGPCSPAPTKSPPTFLDNLRSDWLRYDYLRKRLTPRSGWAHQSPAQPEQQLSSTATIPVSSGDSIGTSEYVVTVAYGTPAVSRIVAIDTGSDLCWIQCTPCSRCYSEQDTLFDPSQSSSYSTVPCSSAVCAQLPGANCSSNSACGYKFGYGDRSSAIGVYSYETLTLTSSSGVQNFLFGCGHDDEGTFQGFDGLMGLGRGEISLASQTAQTYSGSFSYCLPASGSSTGFLALGPPADVSGFSLTPLLTNSNSEPTYYYVELTAISVGGQQLNVPAAAYSSSPTIMDSGTVITNLPQSAYEALRAAFQNAMSAYQPAPPNGFLDTCYDFTGVSVITVPKIALYFEGGAELVVDASGIFYGSSDDWCLAFTGNGADGQLAIIGNVQQRTFEVLYDVGSDSVGFRASAC